jgi:hypothetical protein
MQGFTREVKPILVKNDMIHRNRTVRSSIVVILLEKDKGKKYY